MTTLSPLSLYGLSTELPGAQLLFSSSLFASPSSPPSPSLLASPATPAQRPPPPIITSLSSSSFSSWYAGTVSVARDLLSLLSPCQLFSILWEVGRCPRCLVNTMFHSPEEAKAANLFLS